jgi:hypothetical protein
MKDALKVWQYPTRYSDGRGSESTTIRNDGDELAMSLRGVVFTGHWFDDFSPLATLSSEMASQFTLLPLTGTICGCTIECQIPISLCTREGVAEAVLGVHLGLGQPAGNGGTDRETLKLSLSVEGQPVHSSGESGFFENEMLDLQRQLPLGVFMKACINCAFSDYSPFGHGLFGGLVCFRNCKEEYLQVKSKSDLFRIWDRAAGLVQETYLCPQFQRRVPGTGYRG